MDEDIEPIEVLWTEDGVVPNDTPAIYGVYYIEDDDGIFYVGWGDKNRPFDHLRLKRASPEYLRLAIEDRQARGIEVRHRWIATGLVKRIVRTLEATEIMRIGRADLGRGPLLNWSYGLEGGSEQTQEWSEEQKAAASMRQTAYLSDPRNKEAHAKRAKEYYKNNPEARAQVSRRFKAYFSDQNNRATRSAQAAAWSKTPEGQAALARAGNQMKTEPLREKLRQRTRAHFKDNPEARQSVAEHFKSFYADPKARARQREQIDDHWAKPGSKAAHAEKTRAMWADPDYRARNLEHLKRLNESRKRG